MGTTQANAPRVVRALARILLLSLLAGLFVAPGPALGAWPGSNGRIAFTAIDGLDGAIYVGRSGSTGDPVRPFGSLASTGPPSWSAQGSLAMDTGGDIYYAHPSANAFAGDGGVVPIQLALPGYDFSPSWSPDGTKIVYSKDPEEAEGEPQVAGSDIWVYDFTTEMESLLALGGPVDEEPVWSPSGQHVVFQTIDPDALLPQYDLLFVDTATGQVNPLTAGGGTSCRRTSHQTGPGSHSRPARASR